MADTAAANQRLYDALNSRSFDDLEVALKDGADPNGFLPLGSRPLVRAAAWSPGLGYVPSTMARRGRVFSKDEYEAIARGAWMAAIDMTRALLAAGARIDASDESGTTPLMMACVNGPPTTDVMDMLLARGADANARKPATDERPIHYCAGWDAPHLLARLLEHGAEPDARTNYGRTALIGSAILNNPANIRALLAGGADPTLKDHEGRTAYDHARAEKHHAIARVLKQAMRDWKPSSARAKRDAGPIPPATGSAP